MTEAASPTYPPKPQPVPGESETTHRARMRNWEEQKRSIDRAADAERIGAENAARERAMVARLVEKAKNALTFDKSRPGDYMRARMFGERADAVLAYARTAKKVAAQAPPKPADVAALGDAALALGYAPSKVEADLAALRRYNEKRPEIEQRIANREKADARAAAAVDRFKRAEKELAAARQERADAANQANRCATAPSELQALERGLGELAMNRDQLVEKLARDAKAAEARGIEVKPGVVAYAA